MSQSADIQEIARLAESILKHKEFFIASIVDRLGKVAELHPHDNAIRTAQHALEKRLAKEGSLSTISHQDFQRVYDEVGGLGNKELFRKYLGDFLATAAPEAGAKYNSDFAAGLRDSGNDIELVDSRDVAMYEGLFDDKRVAEQFIESGKTGLAIELASLGFKPDIEVAAANDKMVIYAAAIDSSGGRFQALIPAEIKEGSVLMPTSFVFGDKLVDLNKNNLEAHAQHVAQGGRTVTAGKVLEKLSGQGPQEVVKTANLDGDVTLNNPGLFSETAAEGDKIDLLPLGSAEMPDALTGLAESAVKEALAEVGTSFDRELVVSAKQVVGNELNMLGVQHDKLSVQAEFDGGVVVATNVYGKNSKKTIEVPVSIRYGKVLLPSVFTSGTEIHDFDESSIQAFANDNSKAFKLEASAKQDMTFRELHEVVLKNAAQGRFIEVEEGLNVIQSKFGEQQHKIAFTDMMDLLNVGFEKQASREDEAEQFIKQAGESLGVKESNENMTQNLMYLYGEEVVSK